MKRSTAIVILGLIALGASALVENARQPVQSQAGEAAPKSDLLKVAPHVTMGQTDCGAYHVT